MTLETTLLLVGVGGQGTILAGKVIASWALKQGSLVKVSEVHGMSQRGGSVVTHIRIGQEIFSPLVERGGAEFIIATEKLEAWRWLPYLQQNGTLIVNEQEIYPLPVLTGARSYPHALGSRLQKSAARVLMIDALKIALRCGEPRAANMVLLGVFAKEIGAKRVDWHQALKQNIREQYLAKNILAFNAGYEQKFTI